MTEKIYWNRDWRFAEKYEEEMLEDAFDDTSLERVCLPHTVKQTPFHYFDESIYQMISAYRRTFLADESWKGKRVLLTIEAAAHQSTVFLNGKQLANHRCGYTAYTVELEKYLRWDKENVLVIVVNSREDQNLPPFGFVIDYMTYGGIYRDVYLQIKEPTCLDDVFLYSEFQGKSANLCSKIALHGNADGAVVRQSIKKRGEQKSTLLGEQTVTGAANGGSLDLRLSAGEVERWDIDRPTLYEVTTELIRDGVVLDEETILFGFRTARFYKDGFYLNGKKRKIRGLNRHQSYPYVGYAMPKSIQRLDADILKNELGLNAVRTSHYPQSHHFIRRCDELGLLVFTEIPGWQHIGDEAWKTQAVQNVCDMVCQYRNHPSIILWGVRINESADDDVFYRRTNEAAHRCDPTRQTAGVRAHKKSSLLEDVYTYNDFIHDGKAPGCQKKKKVTKNPDRPYMITEYNGHMYPTKTFDCEEHRVEHALRHATVLNAVAGEEDIAGSFGWCMADYNTHKDFGSGDRICYHGVLDMFRNPKDAAFVYQSQQEKYPVLAVASSMDIGEHPGCYRKKTYIFTNADSVRMFKNGRLIKEFKKEQSPFTNLAHGPLVIDDYIGEALKTNRNLKPGQAKAVKHILNAVALNGQNAMFKTSWRQILKLLVVYHMKPESVTALYNRYVGDWGDTASFYKFEAIKDGQVVKTVIRRPMQTFTLQVETDHTQLVEDESYDAAAVRIRAVDEIGGVLHTSCEPLSLSTEGPIEIIGPHEIALMGGLGGTYVKTLQKEGEATLVIRSPRGEEVKVPFEVRLSH